MVIPTGPLAGTLYRYDPMIGVNRSNGDIWLGGIASGPGDTGIFAVRRQPGVHLASLPPAIAIAVSPQGQLNDKPLMAIGAGPGGVGTSVYVVWSRIQDPHPGFPGNTCTNFHFVMTRSSDDGATWTPVSPVAPSPYPPTTGCLYRDVGAFPVVLETGRIVIAFGFHSIWSDDGGATWPADATEWLSDELAVQDSDVPGAMRVESLPSAAVNPLNGDVYVIAAARAEVGRPNIDLYLARSTDGGQTFDPAQRLPLDPFEGFEGPDQFMPSITVDYLGAIHILYYDTVNGGVPDSHHQAFLDAYYARIDGFGTPGQIIQQFRLTPERFCTACEDCGHPTPCEYEDPSPFLDQFVGDYQWINTAGCDVYACYMTTQTGQRHYYVQRINQCVADVDSNGAVNATDFSLYQQYFMAGSSQAEINNDGSLNSLDFAAFMAAYNQAGP